MCSFLLCRKVDQIYIDIGPFLQILFLHVGHYRVLNSLCYTVDSLINYLFYTHSNVYVNLNLPIYSSSPKYHMICLYMESEKMVPINLHTKPKQSHRCRNKLMVTQGAWMKMFLVQRREFQGGLLLTVMALGNRCLARYRCPIRYGLYFPCFLGPNIQGHLAPQVIILGKGFCGKS